MRKSIIILTAVISLPMTKLFSQEQLGLKISNYSGINAVSLNPAWNVGSPLNWDINIVSLGVFAQQNYFYGEKGSLIKLFNQGGTFVTDENASTNESNDSESIPFHFTDKKNYNLHHNAFVMGPSAMFKIKDHTLGIYFQGKSWVSGYKMDSDFRYQNVTDTIPFVGTFNPFQVGAMAWGEAGINYGRILKVNRHINIHLGGTLKILLGYDAVSIANHTQANVTRVDNGIALDQADMSLSYSTNYTSEEGYRFKRSGFGMGTDLGVTFLGKNIRHNSNEYRWKVGVSILDIGKIRYQKEAYVYTYVASDTSIFSTAPFEDIEDAEDIITAINSSNNSQSAELEANQFGMWLPMALSLQVDAPIIKQFYISGTAIIGMRFKSNAIERSDLLAITPRFETRWFEIGLPFSLYRWKDINFGTYIRIGPLTIGTENLNSWVIPGHLNGSDIYLSLKINSAMFKKSNTNNNKGTGCYSKNF